MKIIEGAFNVAKVFTDVIEDGAQAQIKAVCDFSAFADCQIRIMPDVHAGAGCTIGTTMTIKDKVTPNMVGVDIGCGMELVRVAERDIDFGALDALVYARIPSGFNVRETPHAFAERTRITELRCGKRVKLDNAFKSVGTLGGGNHFIEVDADADGNKYIVVHSGSRHLGVEVAEYYQNEGYRALCGNTAKQIDALIDRLKADGRQAEIGKLVRTARLAASDIGKSLAYVEGELFDDYIHDMKIVQEFAALNRKAMISEITRGLGLTVADGFTTIHNYIDTDNMILRKGAVSAQDGERLLIPINMRDGSLVCTGKGNPDWNYSAPHGAGRILSRGKAQSTLSLDEFEREMRGIYSTSVRQSTLDESPMAYKKIEDILDNIEPTVAVVKRITPVYNFKAAETEKPWKKR